jgi:peptide-methionine (S)-S-oxide reductase
MSQQKASFAAGCFWGVEARFREHSGVVDALSGYMGGHAENPTYKEVCGGQTGHTETVQVIFDDEEVRYRELLDLFFDLHNPTTLNRQGPDFGSQYRSAIFTHDEEQQSVALEKISEINESGKWPDAVVTEVTTAAKFWPAEEYHQRYLEKNGGGHCRM